VGRFATIVDVGGGHGTLLAAILAAHPGIRGHVVDLRATAAGAVRTVSAHGVRDRVQVTASSFPVLDAVIDLGDQRCLLEFVAERSPNQRA
jgi:phytoene dehydrogenase-like protein